MTLYEESFVPNFDKRVGYSIRVNASVCLLTSTGKGEASQKHDSPHVEGVEWTRIGLGVNNLGPNATISHHFADTH